MVYEPGRKLLAFAHAKLTVDGTVRSLASGSKANATTKRVASRVFMTLETGQIRWRVDGGNPTSAIGHLLEIGQTLTLDDDDVFNFKAVRTGGVSGELMVTSYELP